MRNYLTESFHSFVETLNGIDHTVWGIFILSVSIALGWYGKTELCYYFAGVGSTLMGIKPDQTNNISAPNARSVNNSAANSSTSDNPDA